MDLSSAVRWAASLPQGGPAAPLALAAVLWEASERLQGNLQATAGGEFVQTLYYEVVKASQAWAAESRNAGMKENLGKATYAGADNEARAELHDLKREGNLEGDVGANVRILGSRMLFVVAAPDIKEQARFDKATKAAERVAQLPVGEEKRLLFLEGGAMATVGRALACRSRQSTGKGYRPRSGAPRRRAADREPSGPWPTCSPATPRP